MSDNNEIKALAKFLEIDEDDITDRGYHCYEILGSGHEYFVGEYDDAYEAAKYEIKYLFEDVGISMFSKHFQEYILENCCDYPWEEEVEESNRVYCEDIADENSSNNCASRLIEECIDNGIITEDDCHENEDGELDYDDKNELIEKYVEKLNDNYDSMDEWFESIYGRNWSSDKSLMERLIDYIDVDKAAEECIREDGIGHTLSHYDGEENVETIDGTDYYIYRQN